MKHTLFTSLALVGSLMAQDHEKVRIDYLGNGASTTTWDTVSGRSYFTQWSVDLKNWTYMPYLEQGDTSPLSFGFQSNAPKVFTRLRYSDEVTIDPKNADFDGDGISNWNEIKVGGSGSDPFMYSSAEDGISDYNKDSDGGGLPDGWEFDTNGNLGALDPYADDDGDTLMNIEESLRGSQPNNTNTDGDALDDSEDAVPNDGVLTWPRTPEYQYGMMDLGENYEFDTVVGVNTNGDVVMSSRENLPVTPATYQAKVWDNTNQVWIYSPAMTLPTGTTQSYYGFRPTCISEDGKVYGYMSCRVDTEDNYFSIFGGSQYADFAYNFDYKSNTINLMDSVVKGSITTMPPYNNRDISDYPITVPEGIGKPMFVSQDGTVYGESLTPAPQAQQLNFALTKWASDSASHIATDHRAIENIYGVNDLDEVIWEPHWGVAHVNAASANYFEESWGHSGVDSVLYSVLPHMSGHIAGGNGSLFIRNDTTWERKYLYEDLAKTEKLGGFITAVTEDGSLFTSGRKIWRNGKATLFTDLMAHDHYDGIPYHFSTIARNGLIAVTTRKTREDDGTPIPEASQKTHVALGFLTNLITDINNDGLITQEDHALRKAAFTDGADEDTVLKGTEFLFKNDKVSNGLWDKEDSSSDRPQGHVDDDDAKLLKIAVGFKEGEAWFTHPAINDISFYKTKACNPADKVSLIGNNKFSFSPSNPLPEKLYMRADGAFDTIKFPEDNPQFEGDLVLNVKVGGANGKVTEAIKMKLTVVEGFGAEKYFHAANDYIMENNTRIFFDHKSYNHPTKELLKLVVMPESKTDLEVIDAYRTAPGAPLVGIRKVSGAYSSKDVIIAGNLTFHKTNVVGSSTDITKRCHGRLVTKGVATNSSSDNTAPGPWPYHPLRGHELAGVEGKYIAMKAKGEFTYAKGRVPVDLTTKQAIGGITEALGGFSTNYGDAQVEGGYFGAAEIDNNKRCTFVAIDATPGRYRNLTQDIKRDAIKGGVQPLSGGNPGELELFRTDGASSLCLAIRRPDNTISIQVEGSKHTGRFFDNYVMHTYLSFTSDKPRP